MNSMNNMTVKCPGCGTRNNVDIRIFYDGFEGMVYCSSCKEPLDVDFEDE